MKFTGKKSARTKIMVILLCLLFCACNTAPQGADERSEIGAGNTEETGSAAEESGGIKSIEEGGSTDGAEENGSGKAFGGNIGAEGAGNVVGAGDGAAAWFDDKTVFGGIENGKELAGILNEIVAGGQLYPVKAQEAQNYFTISAATKERSYTIRKVSIDGQNALRIGNTYYPYDERLDRFAPGDASTDDVISRLLAQSVVCNEPVEDTDYTALAEKLVFNFLDTLKTETGRYRLENYTPDHTTLEAKGYVGNGTEFCASVYFETEIEDDDSAFYSKEGYDKFYHYYYGPMVYVRCHYENGRCEVVDYADAFQADLTMDLNGTGAGTGAYPTFWEFYDDKDNLKKLMQEANAPRGGKPVAASPIMLADGQIGYVFICPRNGETWEQDGKSYGVYDNYFRTAKEDTYSSPIDYKDGSGACAEQYGKAFELIWDDYNGDGNPEYAIKQDAADEDENGARYEVRCMSNDMTPRSDRFDFYMAGRKEECIHLQMTDQGVVIWNLVNGVMTPSQKVDDVRMYSRRYYLPGNMRGYTDEQEIQCFFWNNTDREVSTGSTYHIEYLDRNEWVKVSDERKIKSVKCPAYRDVTLSFDISGIPRTSGEYRIVLGKEAVCGGFYIRGERVSARILQDETSVTIVNDGTASLRIFDLCWVKDGEVAGRIEEKGGRDYGVVPAGGQKKIELHPLSSFEGMYSVRADVGMILESDPVEYRYVRYFGDAKISQRDGNLVLTVDVNKAVDGDASIEWFNGNDWEETQFAINNLELKAGTQEVIFDDNVGANLPSDEYEEFYRIFMEEINEAKKDGRLEEMSKEEREEIERIAGMSKEDFCYYLSGGVPADTLLTVPLRIEIAGEYVYVNVD